MLSIATGIRDGRDRENIKLTRLDMITIGDFVYKIRYRRARAWPIGRLRPSARASKGIFRTTALNIMCDVISFATPRDGFRERGFVGVTHGPIRFWCSQKLLKQTSFLSSAIV